MQKVALVTGASSGIGKALAQIHASHGGDLVLVARNQELLAQLKDDVETRYGVKTVNIIQDLSIVGAAKVLFDKVKALNIDVEYLFNNAGFGLLGKLDELPWDRQLQMINLNVIALTELTYLMIPEMKTRNRGKILNTSSTASLVPGPLQAVYFASKAFVTSLGNALSEELSDTQITVTNLLPGATETGFASVSGMDKSKAFAKTADAYSVAKEGYDAMMRGDLDVISGVTLMQSIMFKILPFIPKKMVLKNVRQFQEAK